MTHAHAEAVSREFGVPAAYDDIQQMLETERPDFVDICTPPSTHAGIAVAALRADAHVLIEKPMATKVEDCERIIEAERESKGQVDVAHTDLFHQCVIEAHKRVKRGDIGDFTGMRIFYCTPVTLMTATDPTTSPTGCLAGRWERQGPMWCTSPGHSSVLSGASGSGAKNSCLNTHGRRLRIIDWSLWVTTPPAALC